MHDKDKVDELAQIIWDYHHLHHTLQKSDVIVVLGSHDKSVAEHAAHVFLQGWAPLLVFSGGFGRGTAGVFDRTEAETFADIAREHGVPSSAILIEDKATNTGENLTFTKKLLEERKVPMNTIILIQKPYMERRTYATASKQWPGPMFLVSSSPVSFEEYTTKYVDRDTCINIMIGDFQRIMEYPKLGFQIPQEVPEEVLSAYTKLVALGYTSQLIPQ